ncbi:MAG: alpha/beta fold hydrolase [Alphaproteobacteria bacterium]
MKAATVRIRGAAMAVFEPQDESLPEASRPDAPLLVWAHGWGHTHRNMLPLAEAARLGHSVLLDLPGFGDSPPPPAAWGTADYADAVAEFLAARFAADGAARRRVWIGHSFGCRVGLQLAARHPGLISGLFLIAAAGLPRTRSLPERARLAARRLAFRAARRLTPEGPRREALRARFGSADYARAGPLRPILVKAVGEDLSETARRVRCPSVLLYGDRDAETPPEIGARLNKLMPQSQLIVLRGFDHWSVLTDGRHQIVQRLSEFVEQIA